MLNQVTKLLFASVVLVICAVVLSQVKIEDRGYQEVHVAIYITVKSPQFSVMLPQQKNPEHQWFMNEKNMKYFYIVDRSLVSHAAMYPGIRDEVAWTLQVKPAYLIENRKIPISFDLMDKNRNILKKYKVEVVITKPVKYLKKPKFLEDISI